MLCPWHCDLSRFHKCSWGLPRWPLLLNLEKLLRTGIERPSSCILFVKPVQIHPQVSITFWFQWPHLCQVSCSGHCNFVNISFWEHLCLPIGLFHWMMCCCSSDWMYYALIIVLEDKNMDVMNIALSPMPWALYACLNLWFLTRNVVQNKRPDLHDLIIEIHQRQKTIQLFVKNSVPQPCGEVLSTITQFECLTATHERNKDWKSWMLVRYATILCPGNCC